MHDVECCRLKLMSDAIRCFFLNVSDFYVVECEDRTIIIHKKHLRDKKNDHFSVNEKKT